MFIPSLLKPPISTRANILFSFILQVVEKGAGYVVLAVLARTIPLDELGGMFFVISIARLFAVAFNLGTDNPFIRAVASDPDNDLKHLSNTLSLRVVSMTVGYVILNVIFSLFRPELAVVMCLASAATFFDEIQLIFSSFFTGKKQGSYRLLVVGTFKLLGMIFVSFAAYTSGSLQLVLWLQVFLSVALLLATHAVTRRYFGRVALTWDPTVKLMWVKRAAPFLMINVLGLVHMRIDTILMGVFLDLRSVALYEIGIKLVEVARFLVRPFKQTMLPIFSEYAVRSQWGRLQSRFGQLILLAFGIGGGLSVLMFYTSKTIIPFLFGEPYADSALITVILFSSVPFLFMEMLSGTVAAALHLERMSLTITAIAVLLNIVLNWFAIPMYGGMGAAWVTVVSQAFLTISLLTVVIRALLIQRERHLS